MALALRRNVNAEVGLHLIDGVSRKIIDFQKIIDGRSDENCKETITLVTTNESLKKLKSVLSDIINSKSPTFDILSLVNEALERIVKKIGLMFGEKLKIKIRKTLTIEAMGSAAYHILLLSKACFEVLISRGVSKSVTPSIGEEILKFIHNIKEILRWNNKFQSNGFVNFHVRKKFAALIESMDGMAPPLKQYKVHNCVLAILYTRDA